LDLKSLVQVNKNSGRNNSSDATTIYAQNGNFISIAWRWQWCVQCSHELAAKHQSKQEQWRHYQSVQERIEEGCEMENEELENANL